MNITISTIIVTILALWFGWVNFTVLLSVPSMKEEYEESLTNILSTMGFYLFTFFCIITTTLYFWGLL